MELGDLQGEAFGSEVTQVKRSPVKESETSYLKSYFGQAMLILEGARVRCLLGTRVNTSIFQVLKSDWLRGRAGTQALE